MVLSPSPRHHRLVGIEVSSWGFDLSRPPELWRIATCHRCWWRERSQRNKEQLSPDSSVLFRFLFSFKGFEKKPQQKSWESKRCTVYIYIYLHTPILATISCRKYLRSYFQGLWSTIIVPLIIPHLISVGKRGPLRFPFFFKQRTCWIEKKILVVGNDPCFRCSWSFARAYLASCSIR